MSSAASSPQIPASDNCRRVTGDVPPRPRTDEGSADGHLVGRAVAASVRGFGDEERVGGSSISVTETHGPHPRKGGRLVNSSELSAARESCNRRRAASWLRVLVMSALVRAWGAPFCVCPWMLGVLAAIPLDVQEPAIKQSSFIVQSTHESWRPPIVKASLWLPTKAPTKENADAEVYRIGCARYVLQHITCIMCGQSLCAAGGMSVGATAES